jgi:ribonuclease HI
MDKVAFSSQFDYQDVKYVLICDGNYYEGKGRGGIGWILIDQIEREPILEGCKVINSNSTTESEYKSVEYGLKDTLKRDDKSVLVKTDFKGIVSDINHNRDKNLKSNIDLLLSNFNSWCIKIVNRTDTERAHYLADYIIQGESPQL